MDLYGQLVFVALACVVLTLFRVMREPGRFGRAYVAVLLVAGLACLKGAVSEPRIFGLFGVGLTFVAVVVPAVLDVLSRALWSRSRLDWAVRLAELRGHLLTGGVCALHAQMWRALSKIPGEGTLACVRELSALRKTWDGPVSRELIADQIFGVYATDGQWSMAIDSLAARPSTQLRLGPGSPMQLRAFAEQGRFDRAKSLLDAWMSPVVPSPWLVQSQWVFLAMTGDPDLASMASQAKVQAALGLCPAKAKLWTAIAYRAQGQAPLAQQALEELRPLESSLHILERRAVEVVRESLSRPVSLDLSPELVHFAQEVKASLRAYLRRSPRMVEPRGQSLVLLLIAASLARLLAQVVSGGGMDAMLAWGWLSPVLWQKGQYLRVWTAPWLRQDLFDCILVGYLWWISSLHAPARYGLLRWISALLLAPSLALFVMALVAPSHAGAGAASLALVGAMCSVLWSAPLSTGKRGTFRGGAVILALLLLVKLAAALLDPAGGPFAAMAMALTALFVFLSLRAFVEPWRVANPKTEGLALGIALVWSLAWPLVRLGPSVPGLVQQTPMACRAFGVDWDLPARFLLPSPTFAKATPFPDLGGWIDAGAWQGRQWVQLGVLDRPQGLADDALTSLATWPKIHAAFSVTRPGITLPPPFLALAKQDPALRVVQLRQRGEAVALLAERDLQDPAGGSPKTAIMLWQPPSLVQAYLPSQVAVLASARVPEAKAPSRPPCPGTAALDEDLR